jgi:hypothetical protein
MYANNSIPTSLKFKKRSNTYSNSTGSCTVQGLTKKTIEARSYQHWLFVTNINGLVVFNDYKYSISTAKHQSAVRRLLQGLKIKIDVFVEQLESLDDGIILEHLYESLILAEVRLAKSGLQKKTRERLERQRDESGTQLFKLLSKKAAKPYTKKKQKAIRERIEQKERERLEKSRAEAKEKRERMNALKPLLNDLSPIGLEDAEARMNSIEAIEMK